MPTVQTLSYYIDMDNELEVAKFPEDFADWLMDTGREQDAREFLHKCQHYEDVTPVEEQEFETVIEIAEEYAPVVKLQDELQTPSRTYSEVMRLLKDAEAADEPSGGDAPLPWDREAAVINRTLADSAPVVPMDMDDHEFPDVKVYVDDDDTLPIILAKTMLALVEEGYPFAAKIFAQDLLALTRVPRSDLELFELVWSYVDVLPEVGSERERRFLARTGN